MEAKYTKEDLETMQAFPLARKIQIAQTRIIEWYERNEGKVYVSFSGGKDSTVLLDLVRRIYPDVPAVFCDTGLEYPEIREFVKTFANVEWLKPLRYNKANRKFEPSNFREVLQDFGYPVISKDIAYKTRLWKAGKRSDWLVRAFNNEGTYTGFNMRKWTILADAPFKISEQCCDIMKKNPFKIYARETGRLPLIGSMACESDMRKFNWMKVGCNTFDTKRARSAPLSIWLEEDVLQYLRDFNIPYADCYGDIVEDEQGNLKTTLLDRTGCMFCMFGVHCEKAPNRFQRMKETHPQLWDYCINQLGLKEVLEFIGAPYE